MLKFVFPLFPPLAHFSTCRVLVSSRLATASSGSPATAPFTIALPRPLSRVLVRSGTRPPFNQVRTYLTDPYAEARTRVQVLSSRAGPCKSTMRHLENPVGPRRTQPLVGLDHIAAWKEYYCT